jgi:hypothetical protein
VEQRFHEKAKRRASGGQARWAVISFFPFRLSGISSFVREERNLTQRQNCHYTWLCALRPGAAVNNRQVTLQLLPITPNCVNRRPLDHTNANRIHTRFTSSHLPPLDSERQNGGARDPASGLICASVPFPRKNQYTLCNHTNKHLKEPVQFRFVGNNVATGYGALWRKKFSTVSMM